MSDLASEWSLTVLSAILLRGLQAADQFLARPHLTNLITSTRPMCKTRTNTRSRFHLYAYKSQQRSLQVCVCVFWERRYLKVCLFMAASCCRVKKEAAHMFFIVLLLIALYVRYVEFARDTDPEIMCPVASRQCMNKSCKFHWCKVLTVQLHHKQEHCEHLSAWVKVSRGYEGLAEATDTGASTTTSASSCSW